MPEPYLLSEALRTIFCLARETETETETETNSETTQSLQGDQAGSFRLEEEVCYSLSQPLRLYQSWVRCSVGF